MFDFKPFEAQFEQIVEFFVQTMAAVRTGRAHPAMLDSVKVEVYGTLLPLNQVANVTVLDAQMLQVTPFDVHNLSKIAEAIRANQSLGLNPSDDGKVVRVPIPALTEDRRREIIKQAGERVEEAKISIRNVRQDAIKQIKKLKTDKQISEDDAHKLENKLQDSVNQTQERIEQIFKEKETDIMTI